MADNSFPRTSDLRVSSWASISYFSAEDPNPASEPIAVNRASGNQPGHASGGTGWDILPLVHLKNAEKRKFFNLPKSAD
jgi:hypothetical protein